MSMRKTFNIIVSALLAILTFCSLSVSVFATDNSDNAVTPRWASISSVEVDMAFDGTIADTVGTARKQSTADYIEGTLILYKKVGSIWVYLDEWSGSKSVGTLAVGGEFACQSGVTYKAVFTVTAYTDGVGETFTCEYSERCP